MLNQNPTIVFQDNNFRCLFDKVVNDLIMKGDSQFSADAIYHNHFSLLNLVEMNSPEIEKCSLNRGKWRFVVSNWDYTCAVYDAVETIRLAILSAMKADQNRLEIALVSSKHNPNYYYFFNCNKQDENFIDIEKIKRRKVFSHHLSNFDRCECDTGISQKILSEVITPVLSHLMQLMNCKMSLIVIKDKIVSESSKPFSSMYFQRDLKAIRIEWGLNSVFSSLADETPQTLKDLNEFAYL